MNNFDFGQINETEFEEFCCDLLQELGFKNIKWRKGTGLSSSPADRGRDIEAESHRKDIDDIEDVETWFIECKHYTKGLPPDKIQGALAWANSQRPHTLLIIVSGFLSNATSDYLRDYVSNNKPSFRIRTWDRKKLEKLTANKPALLERYGIKKKEEYFDTIHSAHKAYLQYQFSNTLQKFLDTMLLLDELSLVEITDIACANFTFPNHSETQKYLDAPLGYLIRQLEIMSNIIDERFVVRSIVIDILRHLTSNLSQSTNKSLLNRKFNLNAARLALRGDNLRKVQSTFMASDWVENFIDPTPYISWLRNTNQKEPHNYQEVYEQFCEIVVKELLLEQLSG